MKSGSTWPYISGVLLCLTSAPIAAQSSRTAQRGPVARSAPVSGAVVSTKSGEDIRFTGETSRRRVVAGQDLKSGDVIRTNSRGGIAIIFADRTQIRLARNSELEVRSVKRGNPSEVRMRRGRAWGRSPRKRTNLRVSTPSATAAIRGTEWSIDVDDSSTKLEVISGLVSLENDFGAVDVGAGQAAMATPDSAPVITVLVNRPDREQLLYSLTSLPSPAETGDPVLGDARELAFSGALDAALEMLLTSGANEERSAANYALTLEIATLLGREEVIASQLTLAKQYYPKNAMIMVRDAEFLSTYRGRPDLALDRAAAAGALAPDDADVLLALARAQLARHANKEALASINRAVRIAPERADILAFRAEVWLALNRPHHAQLDLQSAEEMAPGNGAVLLGKAKTSAILESPDTALDTMLAASAANPGYGVGLRQLAEGFARTGDRQVAEQQLDAADKLDPYSPYTPLFRNAIALDGYKTDDAVAAANEALRRFAARGGIYESLAENRQTGSSLSRSFRFLDLQGMARYFGDRVYDSFESTSYFDEVLNEDAGLFFLRQTSNGFNPRNGDDVQQTSTYLQGVLLDPLSIANSQRRLQISKEEFTEATLSLRTIQSGQEDQYLGSAGLHTRFYPTFGDNEVPIAFSVEGRKNKLEDKFLKSVRKASSYDSYLGIELTPQDSLVFYGSYKSESYNNSSDHQANLLRFGGEHDFTEDQTFAVGAWRHSLGLRREFRIAYAYDKKGDLDIFYTPILATTDIERVILNEGPTNHVLSAQYADGSGPIEWRLGLESSWTDEDKRFKVDILDPQNIARPGTPIDDTSRSAQEWRAYSTVRHSPSDWLVLEGQFALLRQQTRLIDPAITTDDDVVRFDYRLGAAIEPVAGHWIRLSTQQETTSGLPFSLAPLYNIGLRGSTLPSTFKSRQTNQIVRWDASWTDTLFTAFELQRQRADDLVYLTPDRDASVAIRQAHIDQAHFEANYLPGGDFAIHAGFDLARTTGVVDGAATRSDLPYIPQRTAEVGISWSHSKRIKASLTGKYIGPQAAGTGQSIGGHTSVDLLAKWEPFGRRIELNIGVLNLLDENFEIQPGIPAPGRALFIELTGRL